MIKKLISKLINKKKTTLSPSINKQMLIYQIIGKEPSLSFIERHSGVVKYGSYTGGFVEKWSWDRDELEKLHLSELSLIMRKINAYKEYDHHKNEN